MKKNNNYIEIFNKTPPQALELENGIIGLILTEKKIFTLVNSMINENYFYSDKNKKIYSACIELDKNGDDIDLLTIVEQLKKNNNIKLVGGAYEISQKTNMVVSSANIETHIRIIIENYILREIINITGKFNNLAYSGNEDVFDLLDNLSISIQNLYPKKNNSDAENLEKLHIKLLDKLEFLKLNGTGVTGVNTGLNKLNDYTAGWQKSNFILIAARPSVGKTAFALQLALNAARHNCKVLIFSLEMNKQQLYVRLAANIADVPMTYLLTGKTVDSKDGSILAESYHNIYYDKLTKAYDELHKLNIVIDDDPSMTIQLLKSKIANAFFENKKPDLIIIDYLQLMSGSGKTQNREQDISEISRGVKICAKTFNVPIIALSQLSRAVESRSSDENGKKIPKLSDLRDSGTLEQDADDVMFLSNQNGENSDRPYRCEINVNIAKQRQGRLGNFTFFADLSRQRFNNDEPSNWLQDNSVNDIKAFN